ncbi:MAG: IPT/TIG domain-containing protein, partial [Myxococcales bacterium]
MGAASSPTLAAADPIASSSFTGAEDPLFENGAWAPIFSMSPQGTQFQKNNGAFCDRFAGPDNNHAGAHTTADIPADHYSEIVVGHIGNNSSYVGPFTRIQTSGPSIDSGYLWWGSLAGGANNFLYRIDANGTSYKAIGIGPAHSPFADGDRLRLIARGPVLYGIKNGVREFIFNVGRDAIRYSGGTAGMLAYVPNFDLTNAVIASWAGGAAPASSGTWASSTFAGVEDPLDEGDRWYPLPTYSGFRKAGGFAVGKDGGHNASGAWSIAPPQKQYSEVTLGTVATGGGGPIVRIDRTNPGPTGWLLFLWADNPVESGVYKMNPDGSFTRFQQFTPTLVAGDKWRLTADGNTLSVSRNGVPLFSFTTDGSYPTGDVGIETLTPAFTLVGWEGGDVNGPAVPPTIASFTPTAGPVGTSVTISGTSFTGATAVAFNGTSATYPVTSATSIQATVPAGATTGTLTVTTPSGTATSAAAFTVVTPPAIASFSPASGPVGTSVTINGANFTGATAVAFNGVSASFTVASDSAIQTAVPAGATSGPVSVTTPQGSATSSSAFTVVRPPTVTSFAPASGPV